MTDFSRGNRAFIVIENGLVSSAFANAWLEAGNSVAAFITSDRKSLRSSFTRKLDLYAAATPTLEAQIKKHGIPLIQADRFFSGQNAETLKSQLRADTLITSMTHQIIPARVLELFGHRAINIHPALLPHYKGPQPTMCLLIDDKADRYGGITLHQLDAGIDTGPIIAQRHIAFSPQQNFNIWMYEIAMAAADLARNELQDYLRGDLQAVAQEKGSGSYRKSDLLEFAIGPHKTLQEVRKLVAMPKGLHFRIVPAKPIGRRQSYPVHRPVKAISDPTEAPPRITPVSIELDIRDARIRMWRQRKAVSVLTIPAIPIARHRFSGIGRQTPPSQFG